MEEKQQTQMQLTIDEDEESLTLLLPLHPQHPLFSKKKRLLAASGIIPNVALVLSSQSESPQRIFKQLLAAARICCMDEHDLYFAAPLSNTHNIHNTNDDEDESYCYCYSPINELQSLNLILQLLHNKLNNNHPTTTTTILTHLLHLTSSRLNNQQPLITLNTSLSPHEDILLHWGKDHNAFTTKLHIANVQGAGRGLIADEDLQVGDTALEIPDSIIISEDVLYRSDMFHILKERGDISPETMLLLWSMRERFNSESKYKIFFQSLPQTFNTGLSFGIEALTVLEGTLLFEEIIQAKEHLRVQYDALCPSLCNEHPDIFQPNIYSWDRFLWACELWYSYSMKVVLADGKTNTCLVPIASLLNHSVLPHIVQYGRVDPGTRSMKFSMSRPCRRGEECYLSYGKYSSSHLITFYGFLAKGENVYDVIPLDIDAPPQEEEEEEWSSHMVRGTWLSSNQQQGCYGLPPPLLTYLRGILGGGGKMGREGSYIDDENEMGVLETLCSIFSPMLEGLGSDDGPRGQVVGWDVELALQYKELQRRILSSILAACSAGMQMLQPS